MYTKLWKENIFVTFSICAVGMACDVFVTLLFVPYKDGNMYNQVYGAIGIFLMFVCELIAEKIVSGRKNMTRTYHLSLKIVKTLQDESVKANLNQMNLMALFC